jgi:hypothetical protein
MDGSAYRSQPYDPGLDRLRGSVEDQREALEIQDGTDLSVIDPTPTQITVASSTGTGAVLPPATSQQAGLLTSEQFAALQQFQTSIDLGTFN